MFEATNSSLSINWFVCCNFKNKFVLEIKICQICIRFPVIWRVTCLLICFDNSHLCPACVCQIPGGIIEDSCVLRGIMVNKDVTHPRMRRYIKNPRILLLDCSLEYKKGESQVRQVLCKDVCSSLYDASEKSQQCHYWQGVLNVFFCFLRVCCSSRLT